MFYEREDGATEIRFNSYTIAYKTCGDIEQLQRTDNDLLKDIERLEELITQIKSLRLKIADHANSLRDIEFGYKIELVRRKNYENRVEYSLKLYKTFNGSDLRPILEKMTVYTGRERREALKAFEYLKKTYPTAEVKQYI